MSVRVYGNQYGHYVKADGEHLAFIRSEALRRNCTLEEALNRIIAEGLESMKDKNATL